MIKQLLVYVSLLSLLMLVRAEDMPEGVEIEGEGDNKIIKLSPEKAKREGWLPWDRWYDEEEYENYRQVVAKFFKPLQSALGFYHENCFNVTLMSLEKYEFYIRNWKESTIDPNTTTVVVMGRIHTNETMWVAWKIQEAIDKYKLDDYYPFLRFALVDNRFDENLVEAFDL
jgi:hypothetical protein